MINFHLKDVLNDRNMTVTDLSSLTGISRPALSKLSTGKTQGIQFDTLDKIIKSIKDVDNEKKSKQNKPFTSGKSILNDLIEYSNKNSNVNFKPVATIKIEPYSDNFKETVLLETYIILEYVKSDFKYFDVLKIEDDFISDYQNMSFSISFLNRDEIKNIFEQIPELKDNVSSIPNDNVSDYYSARHFDEINLYKNAELMYQYLDIYVQENQSRLVSTKTISIPWNITLNKKFVANNKQFMSNTGLKYDDKTIIKDLHIIYSWNIEKNRDGKFTLDPSVSIKIDSPLGAKTYKEYFKDASFHKLV